MVNIKDNFLEVSVCGKVDVNDGFFGIDWGFDGLVDEFFVVGW